MKVRNFTLAEFQDSDTAREHGIDNTLPAELEENAWSTLALLQTIRDHLCRKTGRDIPVYLSSGYRCDTLNTRVGGSKTSDHLHALAGDIQAPAFGTPLQLAEELAPLVSLLGVGQLIYERPKGRDRAWVHVSPKAPPKAINRIITVTPDNTLVGIVP